MIRIDGSGRPGDWRADGSHGLHDRRRQLSPDRGPPGGAGPPPRDRKGRRWEADPEGAPEGGADRRPDRPRGTAGGGDRPPDRWPDHVERPPEPLRPPPRRGRGERPGPLLRYEHVLPPTGRERARSLAGARHRRLMEVRLLPGGGPRGGGHHRARPPPRPPQGRPAAPTPR